MEIQKKKITVFDAAVDNLKGKRLGGWVPGRELKLTRLDAAEKMDPDKRPLKVLLGAWVLTMTGTLEGLMKAPMLDRTCQRFELWVKGNGDLVVRYFRPVAIDNRRRLVEFESVPLGNVKGG